LNPRLFRAVLSAIFFTLAVPLQAGEHQIQFGFEQRVRNENWNNLFDYCDRTGDQRNQIRFRTRVWAGVPLGYNLSLHAGLDSETNKRMGTDLVADEVMLETLYLDVQRVFTPRLSLRVGRQDLVRGEGFILSDATPWDGSRSMYVNAADLAWHAGKASTVEFLAIIDPGADRFLPRINDQHRMLTEWDDRALGVYWTNPFTDSTRFEGYYFYKTETNDRRPASNYQHQPNRYIHTWGGRLSGQLWKGWSYSGEWAVQSGHQSDQSGIRAWGGYATFRRNFERKGRPYLLAGYTAMSGDDPATRTVEYFDPLFARGAKWGDLLLYTMVPEKGIGYLTNVSMPEVEAGFSPLKRLALRSTCYSVQAFHPFAGDARFGTGTHRGVLFQARGDITIDPRWRAHAVYERLSPGAFYSDRAPGYFLRFEVSFQVRTRIPL
jgi:hypothetical protein